MNLDKKQYHRDKGNEIALRNKENKAKERLKLIQDKMVYKDAFELMFGFSYKKEKWYMDKHKPLDYRGSGATLNGSKY